MPSIAVGWTKKSETCSRQAPPPSTRTVQAPRRSRCGVPAARSTVEVLVPPVLLDNRQQLGRKRAQVRHSAVRFHGSQAAHTRNYGRYGGIRKTEPQRDLGQRTVHAVQI